MSSHIFETGREDERTPVGRKQRADGAESRRAILQAAANLATTRGLEGLSIGELAQHIGMSKSGLYAHFKSKEELELATIDAAVEIFQREVLASAGASTVGLGRVWALCEAFLGHLERRVYPGGCFFATVSAQLASRPGRPRDRIMEVQGHWLGQFGAAFTQAVDGGELPRGVDIDQLIFEVTAMLIRANFTWIVIGNPHVLEQARTGIRHTLERAGAKKDRVLPSPSSRARKKRTRGGSTHTR